MSLFANFRPRIRPEVVTIIKRSLVGQGKISVDVGQEVAPEDIIGKSLLSSGFRSINLSQLLEISPSEAEKYLQKQIGQTVYRDELLAFKQGRILQGKKIVVSPTDGILDSYNNKTGELRMSFLPKTINLPAAVYGIVQRIDQNTGHIFIKTQTTQVLGVFGSGRTRDGILKIVGQKGGLIGPRELPSDLSEHIIMGRALIHGSAISVLLSKGAHGIITGGIDASDYKSMAGGTLQFPKKMGTDIGISLFVSEGFGSIPIGDDVSDLLQTYKDRFVILDGNNARLHLPIFEKTSMIRIRKVTLPDLDRDLVEPLVEPEAVEIKIGFKARVVVSPYQGEQGRIVYIDKTPTQLPSGAKTFLVTLETKFRKIKIPYSNIEII